MPFLIRLLSAPNGLLVNRYGYSPIALEWDLWLDPASPAELAGANVDHGSPLHLIQQVSGQSLGLFPVHFYPFQGRRLSSVSSISVPYSQLICHYLLLHVGHRHDPEM